MSQQQKPSPRARHPPRRFHDPGRGAAADNPTPPPMELGRPPVRRPPPSDPHSCSPAEAIDTGGGTNMEMERDPPSTPPPPRGSGLHRTDSTSTHRFGHHCLALRLGFSDIVVNNVDSLAVGRRGRQPPCSTRHRQNRSRCCPNRGPHRIHAPPPLRDRAVPLHHEQDLCSQPPTLGRLLWPVDRTGRSQTLALSSRPSHGRVPICPGAAAAMQITFTVMQLPYRWGMVHQ